MHPLRFVALAFVVILALGAVLNALQPAGTSPSGVEDAGPLRNLGLEAAYNLDYDRARDLLLRAERTDPNDAATERALASLAWIQIQFARGAMTVEHYLGGFTRAQVALQAPAPELAARFRQHTAKALTIANARSRARPDDIDAVYDYGAAVGLQASYTATVDGRFLAAMRAARTAYDAHGRVLAADPARKDAGLVVGTYRYLVGSMSLPLRVLAYIVGFGGDKDLGLRMIEEAASYAGSATQPEARFALLLLYNRERRYDDALALLARLRTVYPRNRLLWLEAGATALRAGNAADAERFLSDGIAGLARDDRPRMFGEEALWYLKRGQARLALGRRAEAAGDLGQSVTRGGRLWVQARAHLALGQLADLAGDRQAALREYALAISLADRDNDPGTAAAARQYTKAAYR